MTDNRKRSKIKNDKIQGWWLNLTDIRNRPRRYNVVADTLRRTYCNSSFVSFLKKLHYDLCHQGVTRLWHYVGSKNLPFSTDKVKEAYSPCRTWAELKPQFTSLFQSKRIKATQLLECLNVDFNGPLPSRTHNKYLLTAIDEFNANIPYREQLFSVLNLSSPYVKYIITSP